MVTPVELALNSISGASAIPSVPTGQRVTFSKFQKTFGLGILRGIVHNGNKFLNINLINKFLFWKINRLGNICCVPCYGARQCS
jgi:hypothetical protein